MMSAALHLFVMADVELLTTQLVDSLMKTSTTLYFAFERLDDKLWWLLIANMLILTLKTTHVRPMALSSYCYCF